MRAMRAEAFGGYQDLKLVDIAKPVPTEGQVLVRVTAAGVTAARQYHSRGTLSPFDGPARTRQ